MRLLRVAFVAAALLGTAFGSWSACGDRRRVCDPGASQGCACISGGAGAQVCADDGSRWGACECGAGDAECWRDPGSGLVWQVNPAASVMDASEAQAYCDSLDRCGFADWDRPTVGELRSIIRGCANTETGGPCGMTDTCRGDSGMTDTRTGDSGMTDTCTGDICCRNEACGGCQVRAGPDAGCYWATALKGECGMYWSRTITARVLRVDEIWIPAPAWTWYVAFSNGHVSYTDDYRSFSAYVRCVSR